MKSTAEEFDEVEYEQISFTARQIGKQEVEDYLDLMRAHAFTAWLQGAGGKKSWNEFLRHLSLAKAEPKMTKESKRAIADQAHRIAERIMKMDKSRKKK